MAFTGRQMCYMYMDCPFTKPCILERKSHLPPLKKWISFYLSNAKWSPQFESFPISIKTTKHRFESSGHHCMPLQCRSSDFGVWPKTPKALTYIARKIIFQAENCILDSKRFFMVAKKSLCRLCLPCVYTAVLRGVTCCCVFVCKRQRQKQKRRERREQSRERERERERGGRVRWGETERESEREERAKQRERERERGGRVRWGETERESEREERERRREREERIFLCSCGLCFIMCFPSIATVWFRASTSPYRASQTWNPTLLSHHVTPNNVIKLNSSWQPQQPPWETYVKHRDTRVIRIGSSRNPLNSNTTPNTFHNNVRPAFLFGKALFLEGISWKKPDSNDAGMQ